MKALLLNDTRTEFNFGCQCTVENLIMLYAKAGIEITASVPLNAFNHVLERRTKIFRKPKTITHSIWKDAVKRLQPVMKALCSKHDLVIVNGEGTLHHNRSSTNALTAAMEAVHALQLPVFLVNCTLQEIPEWTLRTLSKCHFIAVREPNSYEYMKTLGIPATESADCLFLHQPKQLKRSATRIIYTPGVTGRYTPQNVISEIDTIRKHGLPIDLLCLNTEDFDICFHQDLPDDVCVLPPPSSLHSLLTILANAEQVVSNRFHLAILASIYNITTTIGRSNTWKMEGLRRLIAPNGKTDLSTPSSVQKARALAHNNLHVNTDTQPT